MSLTGEINQHLQGNRANVAKQFSLLKLISISPANTINSGALIFGSGSLSIGLSQHPGSGKAMELNFGQSFANRMICLYDAGTVGADDQNQFFGIGVSSATLRFHVDSTGFHRFYKGTSSSASTLLFQISNTGSINTINNTLDDGTTGAATFAGLITGNAGLTITGIVNINNSGTSTITIGGGTYNGAINISNASNGTNVQFLGGVIGPNNVFDNVSGGGSSWVGKMNVQSTASATTVTAGAMEFSGGSLSIGRAGTPLAGNATELNFGQSYAQRMICLYDAGIVGNQDQNQYFGFGVTSGTLHYSVAGGSSHKFYSSTSPTASTLLFTITATQAVTSANNTLDDGLGAASFAGTVAVAATVTVTKSQATPGIDIQSTTASDGAYLRIQNTNSTDQVYFGIDGSGLTGIQTGAAIVSTDSTHGLPIYLTPGNGTNWALKAIITASQGYIVHGNGMPWFQTAVSPRNSINLIVTAANILSGIVVTNTIVTSAFTWTTDSGTNIYSAMGSPPVGTTVSCLWSNNNNNVGAIMTIAFGSGVTGDLRGDTLNNNSSMIIYFRCTGTNTFTCYS